MRKIYLLLLALVVCAGAAWAQVQPEAGKYYRVKSGDNYLTIQGEGAGSHGNIPLVAESVGNADQLWTFESTGTANEYKIKSLGGSYISCAEWNCNKGAGGSAITIEEADTEGVFYMKWYNTFKADKGEEPNRYFKVEAVSGIYYPFCDADANAKASWTLVEVPETELVKVTYNYRYNNVTKHTETKWCLVGSEHAAPTIDFVTFTNPEGTIATGGTYNLECGTTPFESADSYENIKTWYAAKLHSNQTHYMYWTGSAIAFTDALPAGDKAYGWAFVGNPFDGFKVYNNLAGENVVLNNSNPCSLSEDSEDKFYVKPGVPKRNSVADGYFTLKFDGQEYLNYQSGNIARWWDNDEGSTWKLEEIDLSVDAAAKQAKTDALALISASSILFGNPATEGTLAYTAKTAIEAYTYDKTSETEVAQAVAFYNSAVNTMCAAVDKDIVFYNTNRGNNYMVVTDAVQMSGAAANGTSIFHVKGVESTNHFTIQNKANGRYIANTPATSNRVQLSLTAGEFTIKSFGTDNMFAFISTNPANSTYNSLHLDGSHKVVAWEADNEGSASVWVIQEPAANLSLEEGVALVKEQAWNPINTMKNNLGSVQIGNGLGQYNGDEATVTAFQTALNAIPTSIDGLDFEAVYALNTEKNNLQAAYNALSLTRPNGKAFTIKGKQNGRYLSSSAVELDLTNPADASVNRVQMVTEENADIYLLTADNGLVSYTAGLGFTISEKVAVPGTAINIMNFEKGNSAGYYVLRSDYAGNPYLYNRSDRTILCSNASKAGDNTDWTLTEVTALPIKMNAVGGVYYATFNAPVSVVIPEGLKAYSATIAESGDVLNLTKVAENGAVLAANTPVILYSEADVTALTISAEEGNAAASNDLSGTNQKITVTANENYVLGNKGGIGFYKYNNTTMPAFKAYLSSNSEAPAFSFSFGDMETAIKAIESDNSKAVIYDIAGRRVQKAAKGLYIVNGKKVMFN